MNAPKISVIVPVYNAAATLDRCVESVLGQSVPGGLELILVDDGSRDASPALCDGWAARDDRVRVIHQPNGGPSAARNAGLDAARGEYLGFVDADDRLLPGVYTAGLDRMEHEQLDLLVFGLERASGCRACNAFSRLWMSIQYAPSTSSFPSGDNSSFRWGRRADMPSRVYDGKVLSIASIFTSLRGLSARRSKSSRPVS